MNYFQSNVKESRHLRDCITILQENIPKKRRRLDEEDSGNNDPDNEALYSSDGGVGHALFQEERKACLKELLPVLICGPLVPKSVGKKLKDPCDTARSSDDDNKAPKGQIEAGEEEPEDTTKSSTSQQVQSKGNNAKEDPLMCYKKRLEDLKQDNEMLQQRRRDAFQSYASLISKYEYGLNHISNLGSLAESPDNVMDGNFAKKSYTN